MSADNDRPDGSVTTPMQLRLEMDPATAQGVYANLVMIAHTESEFVLDFVFVQPPNRKATVRSRVILSPRQAKRLVGALTQNVQNYETRFGPIALGGAQASPYDIQ